MESLPNNNRAQKRAQLSLLFGVIWLLLGLTWLGLMQLSHGGPLENLVPKRLSPTGVVIVNILYALERAGFILWVGSGVACILTAFPQPENPRTWQGRTAVLLAFVVLLIFLPSAFCLLIWYWPQF